MTKFFQFCVVLAIVPTVCVGPPQMHPSAMYGHHPPPGMHMGMHQAVPPHGKTVHAEVNQIISYFSYTLENVWL